MGMPRQRRLLFPGYPLHIVHRGVNRGACFRDDSDREFYLGLLQEHLPDSGGELHAYVLMTNHVHLLFTPNDDQAAARLMKAVAQRYSQRCNRRWPRSGPLWEGRFMQRSVRLLAPDVVERRMAYRALFDTPQLPEVVELIREAIRSGLATGPPEFVEHVAAVTGRRAALRNRRLVAA